VVSFFLEFHESTKEFQVRDITINDWYNIIRSVIYKARYCLLYYYIANTFAIAAYMQKYEIAFVMKHESPLTQ